MTTTATGAGKGKGKGKGTKPRTRGKKKNPLTAQQRLAILVGGVGAFVLLLSVWECTTALHSLTGMPYLLAALLAIGIDMGMVTTEMAAVAAAKGSDAHKWAERYIALAVGLSVVLNAAAASVHADDGAMKALAAIVGGVVPILVYIAGRVAGGLWTAK